MNFFIIDNKIIESADLTYHQRIRDVILNRTKDYHEIDKEGLREQARNKYRNLSDEEKKKRDYGRNRYHNMFWRKETKIKRISKKLSRLKKVSI